MSNCPTPPYKECGNNRGFENRQSPKTPGSNTDGPTTAGRAAGSADHAHAEQCGDKEQRFYNPCDNSRFNKELRLQVPYHVHND